MAAGAHGKSEMTTLDAVDLSYLGGVALAGAVARAIMRGLPAGVRLRLNARPAEELKPGWIWVHAVSVGELILADGVVRWLKAQGHQVHVTTGTEAGMELLARKQTQWGVTGGAFPLDDPKGLQPFLQTKPGAFLALETELWPNLLRELQRCDVPRLIVNGRLTARSLQRGGPWMRRAASRLSMVAARDSESAERFQRLGAPRVDVGGNLKADLPPPAVLHDGWKVLRRAWAEAPILVAGNTVEGEEGAIVTLWQRLREGFPSLRLLLAPRQPRRFEEVARLFSEAGLAFHRASQPWPDEGAFWAAREALLLDTLGELPAAYGEGTVALVGGGWGWHGGHNPLEPVRWGLPTFVGEGYSNFEDLVKPLREAGLLRVASFEALEQALAERLRDATLRPGLGPAPSLPASLEGSLARTLALIEPFLPLPGKTEGTP